MVAEVTEDSFTREEIDVLGKLVHIAYYWLHFFLNVEMTTQ